MQEELCIHLIDPATCYICTQHLARDRKQAQLRKKRYLQLLAAGVIKPQAGRRESCSSDPIISRRCEALFEDDRGRYNKRVR